MLTITADALSRFAALLGNTTESDALRISLVEGELRVGVDEIHTEDEVFEHDGRVVLVLDGGTAALLTDRTLDVEQAGDGTHLTLS